MITLRSLAWKLLKANRLLIASSTISIVLSIVLVTTMFSYGIGARQALERSLRETYGEADLLVSYSPDDPYVLTDEIVTQLTSLNGVGETAEVLHGFLPLDDAGTTVFTVGVTGHPLTKSGYHFTSEVTPQTIILTRSLAQFLQVSEGDSVSIGGRRLTLSEVIDGAGGAVELAIVHPSHLRPYMAPGERASGLMIKLAEGADAPAVAGQMKRIDENLRIDLREENRDVTKNVQTLQLFLAVLSVLVLAVSVLLVLSNFELLLYKLRHQIAILRSLGATARQIGAIVRNQSLVMTGGGTALGVVVSLLGIDGLFRFAERVFQLPPAEGQVSGLSVAGVAVLCGAVFQLFLLIPVRRAVRILPVRLAEDLERLDFRNKRKTKRRGLLALPVGLFAYAAGMAFERHLLVFAGILAVLAGSLVIVPSVLETVLKGWRKRIGRSRGRHIDLAVTAMLPQARKNAFSVLSVALVLIIAVFGSTLLTTLDANHHRFLKDLYKEAPIQIRDRVTLDDLDPYRVREAILRLPSVRDVTFTSGQGRFDILLDGDEIPLHTIAAQSPLTEGLQDDELVLSAKTAERLLLQPGDEMTVGYYDPGQGKVLPLSVFRIARISHELDESMAVVSWTSPLRAFPGFDRMHVETDDEERTLAELESVLENYPQLTVRAYSHDLELARQAFLQRWAIFIVVLIALMSATLAGVIHTFVNNMLARRKEYAVLRAVGVTPGGIVGIILSQAGFSLGTGIAVGLAAGVGLILLVLALDPSPVAFHYPLIGLTCAALLISVSTALALAGRRLATGYLPRELTMDGK